MFALQKAQQHPRQGGDGNVARLIAGSGTLAAGNTVRSYGQLVRFISAGYPSKMNGSGGYGMLRKPCKINPRSVAFTKKFTKLGGLPASSMAVMCGAGLNVLKLMNATTSSTFTRPLRGVHGIWCVSMPGVLASPWSIWRDCA